MNLCRQVLHLTAVFWLFVVTAQTAFAKDNSIPFRPPRIAVVLAHGDDDSMIVASLERLTESGAELHIVFATDGEGGRTFDKNGVPSLLQPTAEELRRIRDKELDLAMGFLRPASIHKLHLPDVPVRDPISHLPTRSLEAFLSQGVWDLEFMRVQAAEIFSKVRPDYVITMGLDGGNHAHHKAVRFVIEQMYRHLEIPTAKALLAFEETGWVDSSKGREARREAILVNRQSRSPVTQLSYLKSVEKVSSCYASQPPGHKVPHAGAEVLYVVAGKLNSDFRQAIRPGAGGTCAAALSF